MKKQLFFLVGVVVVVVVFGGADEERKDAFLDTFGGEYGYRESLNTSFDAFVSKELGGRLAGDTYLDWAASALYTESQIDEIAGDLKGTLYGNPHSLSASSTRSTEAVEAARLQILEYLGASPDEYEVIFTRSCTDSLRLVAETFPWRPGGEFKYLVQNHNSVLGIRDVARERGARASAVEPGDVEAWLADLGGTEELSLFAYPGEENFAGEMFPMEWAAEVVARQTRWRALVDVAKLAATHPINLTKTPVDFATLSFYKLFGAPTGVGALVARRATAEELTKCYWGGGSVSLAGAGRAPEDDLRVLKSRICERFEDGTVSFLGIAMLRHGFNALSRVGGPREIQKHVKTLADYLDDRLRALRHANGELLVVVYGPEDRRGSTKGPVVNFNVRKSDGDLVSHVDVMEAAAKAGIHVRAGAECNPGAAYDALGLPPTALNHLANDASLQGCGQGPAFVACPASQLGAEVSFASDPGASAWCATPDLSVMVPTGSLRASIGYLSTFQDVEALAAFLEAFKST
ncbi:hypothetical protein CTAYLR_002089 [Chrysophaeum taylorii]|uniref:Aminotransferase class V domain-containing protein n=1 Tax=Chrysophaeum taylorii TaxID=2483200 RepID=A0AAD7UMN1_9STRA|nr:hypothetical protein CTAYLR_002089 [Chrysophaeum taylorii]